MSGGKKSGAMTFRKVPQLAEFHMPVAKDTRIGRSALPVLTAKIVENPLKVFAEIQHMELYPQLIGNHLSLCLRVAGTVVCNHEHAFAVKTIPAQQRRGGRTVHSAA